MKMMKISKPEILAPVGSEEMLVAAVRSGADAVYLGANNFNARRNAENFSEQTLTEAIKYCHVRGVRVYLTLNTCLRDDEIPLAVATAKSAYLGGIDGIIVADLGLAARLHHRFPNLPLHASTQLSVMSVSALPFLKKAGFSRVVISREMGKTAIKEFTKKAREMNIETEVFVHGALCMSVSGQCLLSAVIGGRSGNRGLCAGPCRLPFNNGVNGYALSLKDLSLLEDVAELAEMGVASLKIEGRMKRPEYVAAAVTAFKGALENNENCHEFANDLKNVFSRSGFTRGYYCENLGSEMFGIRTKDDVISSADVINKIHALYRGELQKIPVKITFSALPDEQTVLTISDGENTVTSFGAVPQTALKKSLSEDVVAQYITKFGNTPYFAEKTEINLSQGLFLQGAELNALRRECTEKLNSARAQAKPIFETDYNPLFEGATPQKNELYCRFESVNQIPDDLSGISLLTLPLETDITNFTPPKNIELAVELPRAVINENQITERLKIFLEKGFKTAFCGTLATKQIAENFSFKVIADIGFNIYNSDSAASLSENGISEIVLSAELTVKELNSIVSPVKKGYFAYGRLPLMITRNCPVKDKGCTNCNKDRTITDRMGIEFPVRCRSGFAEVFNSKPHYLANKKADFANLDFAYLYFTFEKAEDVQKILSAYRAGKKPINEFTRGLYYRGVQ